MSKYPTHSGATARAVNRQTVEYQRSQTWYFGKNEYRPKGWRNNGSCNGKYMPHQGVNILYQPNGRGHMYRVKLLRLSKVTL